MDLVCHRCGTTIETEAYYCQQCGAPQLGFVPPEDPASSDIAGTVTSASGTERGSAIHWKLTIRIAALIAVCVGLLSTLLAAGSVLWVAIGAVLVIGIYHKRRPHALLEPRIGARIGMLVGLFAASVAMAGNAAFLVIQRYGMHQGTQIDSQLTSIVKQAALHASTMDPQAPIATFTKFWLSAEGRIGLILLTMGFLSGLILLFAVVGGVLGAQIYRSPRGRKALP